MTTPSTPPNEPQGVAPAGGSETAKPEPAWVLICSEGFDPVYCETEDDIRKALLDGIFPHGTQNPQDDEEFAKCFEALVRDKILRFEGDPPVELLEVKRCPRLAASESHLADARREIERTKSERDEARKAPVAERNALDEHGNLLGVMYRIKFPADKEAYFFTEEAYRKLARDFTAARATEQRLRGALEKMVSVFDSDTARRMYTASCTEGWTMLEIGACADARTALREALTTAPTQVSAADAQPEA